MKRAPPALRLAICLLLAAGCGTALADRSRSDMGDSRGAYRGDDRRGSYPSNDRRGPDGAGWGERTRAQERPLGTSRDERRDHAGDDRWRGPDHRYGDPDPRYRYDRYDRDARRAAESVRRDERGRVLSSQPDHDRGYRVRVLTPDGYVRERYVDPRDDHRR